jgi:hypothetical protein
MLHASIVSFLEGRLLPLEFGREIEGEVAVCVEGCRKHGSGFIVVTDGPEFAVTREHAARLLVAVKDGQLRFDAANYLADGLIMGAGFYFADDEVADAIHFLADDSSVPTESEIATAFQGLQFRDR